MGTAHRCRQPACRRPLTVYFVSSQLCWQAQSSSSTAPSLNKNCKLRVKRSGAASILILSSAEQQLDQDQLIQSEISVGQQIRPVLYRNLSSPEAALYRLRPSLSMIDSSTKSPWVKWRVRLSLVAKIFGKTLR